MPSISQNAFQNSSQKVALSGVMGSKALLVIDGATPKLFDTGQLFAGVRLISAASDSALLEISGKRVTLRVGEAPVSVGSNGSVSGDGSIGKRITLPMSSGGHFMANSTINGRAIQFMVDTGASSVALGISDAQRLGLDYLNGTPVRMSTANGVAQGWRVVLSSVRVGDVELFGVEAVVGPNMPFALLGNSFLSRFSMNKNADVMVLERRF
jgi:aspartyl protease family protein